MSETSLPPEILGLSVGERVALVERIWESVVEDAAQFEECLVDIGSPFVADAQPPVAR